MSRIGRICRGGRTGGDTGEEEHFRPDVVEYSGFEFCETPCSEKRVRSGHFFEVLDNKTPGFVPTCERGNFV